MKSYLLLSLLTFFGSFQIALGQSYVFRVLANKGENTVRSEVQNASWSPIKTGAVLKNGDQLKVSMNAYIGLVHTSGKTLELKEPGDYSITELGAKINSSPSSVASKYADFVLSKVADDGENIDKHAKKYQNVTGAVERAIKNESLAVLLPISSEVFQKQVNIRWAGAEGAKPGTAYTVIIKNSFDEVVLTQTVDQPSFIVDFEDAKIKDEDLIIFSVKIKGQENIQSGEFGLKKISDKKRNEITHELVQLQKDTKENSALDHLIMASFYEQNNLILEAMDHYEKAMRLSPEVLSFKEAYEMFLENKVINK
jgi:hypothetical protein